QHGSAFVVAVVADPAEGKAVDLRDPLLQSLLAAAPVRDVVQTILGALQAFWPDAEASTLPPPVAEELAFPDRGDRTLRLVDPKPELAFQEGGNRGDDPFPRCLRAHIDVAVVGVAAEPVAPAFQFLVQVVQ